jgi:hypothetical protein
VQSAVKVAALDQPADVSDALLLDVSGAGMKIIAGVWWPVDTRVVVEMENHVVVAVVRNVNPRGLKFSLGAERLLSVLKHTLPADASREEWHKLLLAEIGEPQETPSLPPALIRESSALREPGMTRENLPLNGSGAHYEPAGNVEAGSLPSAPGTAHGLVRAGACGDANGNRGRGSGGGADGGSHVQRRNSAGRTRAGR